MLPATRGATSTRSTGDDIERCEFFDLARRSALIRKLSVLVVIGDTDGHRPIGDDEPWLRDDAAEANKPHDSETAAKINWRAAGVVQAGERASR